jgi:hypothetical protein
MKNASYDPAVFLHIKEAKKAVAREEMKEGEKR